ncbi:tyrosine-type recombinase/integrase [Aquabacter sp. CN5-332]|uniref:tyrosine-type recombinase/integrase n=1 Tax=Aquabacter sp. CN5-332 TaxID=3156608 RepID=UPI0032B4DA07
MAREIEPHKRSGYWYLVRRVPKAFSELDRRVLIRESTHIAVADDPRGVRARGVVRSLNAELEEYWRGLAAGRSAEAQERYDEARKLARRAGFNYIPIAALADLPDEILRRLAALAVSVKERPEIQPELTAALLAGEEAPSLRLSGLLEAFEDIQRASLSSMSEDQVRRWRSPKARAISNLIDKIGDKPVADVTRNDALDFRDWWQDRVLREGIEIETANKDFGHINRMFRTVDNKRRLGLQPVFGLLRIEGGATGQRAAYDAAFVQDKILAAGTFGELNIEARCVIYLIADTGLRPSEVVNLTDETIFLDADIPYVHVVPDGRKMKTPHSERKIPLVGAALAAARRCPAGFPRYRDKSAGLSAYMSRFFREKGLRPSPAHSLYSLRHTFEDRLTAIEAPEKVIAQLMGHKWSRPRYGAGPSLAQAADWLSRIAFRPPPDL